MLFTRTSCRLKPLALAVAVAALAVPMAQATLTPTAGKYGPPDPWAYNLIHRNSQSVALITAHSAGQNGTGQARAAGKYGPLDPAIAAAIHNHSGRQNAVSRRAAAPVPAAESSRFDWSDAATGAAIAVAAMLLAIAAAALVRRSRARLANLQG
jgi:hypothetical protein